MSVVNFNYPDGKVESKKLLAAIKKNGTEIVVVDLDFVDNGHKVTGVLYNSDGFYHNILDQAKWDEIRGYLVDSIHGVLTDDEYQVVSDINVSADPYRQLSLRDENFASLVDNYEAFLSRVQVKEEPVEVADLNTPVEDIVPTETPVAEVNEVNNTNESVPSEEISTDLEAEAVNMESIPANTNLDLETEPAVTLEENSQPEDIKAPEEMSLSDLIANAPVAEVNNTSTLTPFGEEPTEPTVEESNVVTENQEEAPQEVAEEATVVPMEETISIMDAPITEMPIEEKVEEQSSIVTDNYMNGFAEIKEAMNKLADDAISKIENIRNEFNSKIDDLANQAKGSLQEAKAYGELARDTFDKAQNNVNNLGLEQNTELNDSESVLNITRAA